MKLVRFMITAGVIGVLGAGTMSSIFHPHVSCTRIDEAVGLLLEGMPYLDTLGPAKIDIARLRLPHFETATLVVLVGPTDVFGTRHVIGISPAEYFCARRAIDQTSRTYPIARLRESTVDQDANVTLPDGTHVYDVRLDRHEMPGDLTAGERLALAYCLSWQERTETIERNIPYSVLDERLSEMNSATLRELVAHVATLRKSDSTLPAVSSEVFRTALWKTGKRRLRQPM